MQTLRLSALKEQTLLRILAGAGYIREENEGVYFTARRESLTVDFRQAPFIQLRDLCVIALVVRVVAELDESIEIVWPDARNELERKRRSFLGRIGFAQAFVAGPGREWARHVRFSGDLAVPAGGPSYAPLTWLAAESFESPSRDFWGSRPRLRSETAEEITSLLRKGGYLDEPGLQKLLGTVLHELGWNVVLHAQPQPGIGVGVFCASISSPNSVDFCIADLGQGISASLSEVYAARAPKWIRRSATDEPTKRILFALTDEGSRRPLDHQGTDPEGFRGLRHLADELEDAGSIVLQSAGGTISLTASARRRAYRTPAKRAKPLTAELPGVPGTQISGRLHSVDWVERVRKRTDALTWHEDAEVVVLAEPNGTLDKFVDPGEVDRLVEQVVGTKPILLLDFGFSQVDVDLFQLIAKRLIRALSGYQLVFWNVALDWAALRHLSEYARLAIPDRDRPPIIVRSASDVATIGVEYSPMLAASFEARLRLSLLQPVSDGEYRPQLPTGAPFVRCEIPVKTYHELASKANSVFLERGFARRATHSGFYSGSIELLSGQTRKRFFSLAVNVAGSRANLLRWADAIATSILAHDRDGTTRRANLVAFSGPMREVLREVSNRLRRTVPHDATLLLTYDLPSRDDVSRIVRPGHPAFLITDVLSSASLLNAVRDTFERAGGDVSEAIALVDGRLSPDRWNDRVVTTWARFIEPDDNDATRWWVDPVSMIPASNDLYDEAVDSRVKTTIDLIVGSGSATCGHVVDGPRHASLGVDMQALLNSSGPDVVKSLSDALRQRVFSSDEWSDFAPNVVMFPGGIGRIEVIDGDATVPNVSSWRTASRDAMPFVREAVGPLILAHRAHNARAPEMWKEIEVPRAFEPGGQSRCPSVLAEHTPDPPDSCDVLIVDDGMASGKTAVELIKLAVAFGAKRVAIIAVLARMRTDEIAFWEGLENMRVPGRATPIPVRFVFPMYLPVPYRDAAQCPYEATARLLTAKASRPELVPMARQLQDTLLHGPELDLTRRSTDFVSVWVEALTLVELAGSSRVALRALLDLIKLENERNNPIRLRSLLALFLEEWRMLTRPRLRQVVAPELAAVALRVIGDNTDRDLSLAALAFLRNRFPRRFVVELSRLSEVLSGVLRSDLDALERMLFHIATLSVDEIRGPEVSNFARRVVHIGFRLTGPERNDNDDGETARRIVMIAQGLLATAAPHQSGDRDQNEFHVDQLRPAIKSALGFLDTNPVLRHMVRARLHSLTLWKSLEVPESELAASLEPLDEVRQFFISEVARILAPLRMLIADPAHATYAQSKQHLWKYLVDAGNAGLEVGSIRGNISERIGSPGSLRYFHDTLSTARGLHDAFCNWEPRKGVRPDLYELLRSYGTHSIGDLVERIAQLVGRVRTYAGDRVMFVDHSTESLQPLGKLPLFAPPVLLNEILGNLEQNLSQWAFGQNHKGEASAKVRMYSSAIPSVSSPREVEIVLVNNGWNVVRPKRQEDGPSSMEALSERLRLYGGRLAHAYTTGDADSVAFAIGLQLW